MESHRDCVHSVMLRMYHRLPAPLRSAAATLRGRHLRAWRYGPETDELVEQALLRDNWSAPQWAAWREERLAYVLHRAATRVPFYRDRWNARRRRGDRASWELLKNWTILDKEPLRREPRAFLADDLDGQPLFHEHTSGTTGKPLHLWWSRSTVRQWYALFEARWRRWYGVSRHDRWAMLGGQLVTPARQNRPPYWIWNAAQKQLYMSSYHLSPERIPAYIDAIRKHDIRYLFGYTSSLVALARGCTQADGFPPVQVAVTNAEPLFPSQRETMQRAFGCAVRETYGMAEIVAAAGECEAGTLHLWPEAGHIEIVDGGDPVEEGGAGDLVCTGLLNADMPLIRYRNGDRGALRAANVQCGCLRTLPALASIDGRADDVLVTRDGRRIGRLDPVFKSDLPIREAQIIQESLERLRLRVVPAAGFGSRHTREMVARLRDRMGDVTVEVEQVDAILRTENGKFRMVVSHLSAEERNRARS